MKAHSSRLVVICETARPDDLQTSYLIGIGHTLLPLKLITCKAIDINWDFFVFGASSGEFKSFNDTVDHGLCIFGKLGSLS